MGAPMTLGLRAQQSKTGNTGTTLNFIGTMYGLVFINDGITDITININGYDFIVKPGEIFDEYFEPFSSVIVTNPGNSAYRAYARG